MKKPNRLFATATALLLGACSLIPDYRRPPAPVAADYPSGPAYHGPDLAGPDQAGQKRAAPADLTADEIGWHSFFADPQLQRLVGLALRNNRDLRVAVLNVAAAQAQYRIQRSDLFPHIDLTGSDTIEREPSTLLVTNGVESVSRTYDVGLGFTSYELDLFGRVRSLNQQALQLYLQYAETRRSTQISLVAQVATAYLTLLSDQELLRLTQDTLTSQQNSYRLTKATFDAGATTALALREAETSVDSAQGNLAQYTRQVAQDENALTLLIGEPLPKDLPKARSFDDQQLLADLPAGLPSTLLERRPDILAAEHGLLAANANIGAARAAFFPQVSLTGSFGTATNSLNSLFSSPSRSWTFAPSVTVPIFEAGELQADLDLAKIQKNIQIADYEKAIQTAFQEVANALAARSTLDDQIKAQQALVDAYADSYNLSMMRFRAGVDNYLSTLDSQRSLYGAQQSLIAIKLQRLENLVTLYKALGGGWNANDVAHRPAAPGQGLTGQGLEDQAKTGN